MHSLQPQQNAQLPPRGHDENIVEEAYRGRYARQRLLNFWPESSCGYHAIKRFVCIIQVLRNPVAALIVAFFFIALPPFCGLRLRLRAIALALRAAIWLRTNTNCETRMRTPKSVSPARVLSAGKSEALYSNRVRFL